MSAKLELYTSPDAMEPLFPDDNSGRLETLAIKLIESTARLSGTMNPITRTAIADFLRPMNSYYSNLIEGHDTHPIDIDRALRNDFSTNKTKRDLQMEAHAHINLHKSISEEINRAEKIPSAISYIKEIHKKFYDHLPEDFRTVKTKEGKLRKVIPGEFRDCEVEVGRHVAPRHDKLNLFGARFEEFYSPESNSNKSVIRRIISIAASHHRLAWIHPFLDGNGRVVRLYSDACFMYEKKDASGLWSISRGLARTKSDYTTHLANADQRRINDYDGRGNLSNKFLIAFCEYFLSVAIDQAEFMYKVIDTENMRERINGFAELMTLRGKLRKEAKFILTEVFLKGKISQTEAMKVTNTSDKTLKLITNELTDLGLLISKKEGTTRMYYVSYPILFSPILFPGIYPPDKEIEMMNYIK